VYHPRMTETATAPRPTIDADSLYEAVLDLNIDEETDQRSLGLTVYDIGHDRLDRRLISETPLLDSAFGQPQPMRCPAQLDLPTLIARVRSTLGMLGLRTPQTDQWTVGVDYNGTWIKAVCRPITRG
jgi:hypothetical protein